MRKYKSKDFTSNVFLSFFYIPTDKVFYGTLALIVFFRQPKLWYIVFTITIKLVNLVAEFSVHILEVKVFQLTDSENVYFMLR
jgi:hypothetical protein